MRLKVFELCLGLLVILGTTIPAFAQQNLLKVSLSKNVPLVFSDENGEAQGIYVDIIEHIAEEEGWTLQFVPCTWQECQQFLADGTIDLLMSVAYTEERAQKFDFTTTSVFNNWAYIYRHPGSQIESIADLQGKAVATVSGNILSQGLRDLLVSFDIQSDVVEVEDYPDVFRLVEEGTVAAGVANRLNGFKFEQQFNVEKTSIVFHPIELLFATAKGKNMNVREAIDRHLSELKADSSSMYY